MAYLAWYWQTSDSHLLVKKPVQTWKSKDVATWISELGWAKVYADSIKEKEIGNEKFIFIRKWYVPMGFDIYVYYYIMISYLLQLHFFYRIHYVNLIVFHISKLTNFS